MAELQLVKFMSQRRLEGQRKIFFVTEISLGIRIFSGDGRGTRFSLGAWLVFSCRPREQGRNKVQINKGLRAKCVQVRASRFYTRRI